MARRILGIAGPPGAGKTTYAERLVAESAVPAVHLPMDGFHLADVALSRLGLLDLKGAPETFDPGGTPPCCNGCTPPARRSGHPPSTASSSSRSPVRSPSRPRCELVVTEGNYLLLDRPEWLAVRAGLDEVWFLDVPDDVRRAGLVARHIAYGKSATEALDWVARVDDANAVLVTGSRAAADRFVERLPPAGS